MRLAESPGPEPRRDPAHVLFDHACDLLAAAQGMRASAPAAGTAPAFAATLGCLEATLDALAAATRAMGEEAVERAERIEEAPAEPGTFTSRQALRRFDDLVDTLQAAQATAGALRERVGAITVAQRAD
jgi:hypothetical protein